MTQTHYRLFILYQSSCILLYFFHNGSWCYCHNCCSQKKLEWHYGPAAALSSVLRLAFPVGGLGSAIYLNSRLGVFYDISMDRKTTGKSCLITGF
jgi:hypothetical protein